MYISNGPKNGQGIFMNNSTVKENGQDQTFHRNRVRAILLKHPEIQNHFGPDSFSLFWIVALVLLQITMAAFLRGSSWVLIIGTAYLFGAFVSHGLMVLVHDATHYLISKHRWVNRLSIYFANLPGILPYAESFRIFHMQHHAKLGDPIEDLDVPGARENDWLKKSPLHRAFWITFYFLFISSRIFRLSESKTGHSGIFINILVQIFFSMAVAHFLGLHALLYLALSFFFSVGPHPLGARWIQEHSLASEKQPTFSYYGPLNALSFNMGYHLEHHDFPMVPWSKLTKVHKIAHEFYDSMDSFSSWSGLVMRFIWRGPQQKNDCISI